MDYKKIEDDINEKLIKMILSTGESISDVFDTYDRRKQDLLMIYRNPSEHYSKILVGAYIGTIKEYTYNKEW